MKRGVKMATLQERKNVAENIRLLRECQRMTQEELATVGGVSKNAIDQYENGSYIPNMITAVKIAKVLGTTCEELITGEPQTTQTAPKK
jgi:DNA-binding XRE family transcriptional regulator